MITIIKSLKIRLLPTVEQEQKLWQHVGAARWIWNYMLAEQERRYESGEKHLSQFDMNNLVKPLKNQEEFNWLKSISHDSLCQVNGDLAVAYSEFFKKTKRHPKFKSRKRATPKFPLSKCNGKVWFSETHVQIPIIGKVKYQTNYVLPLGNKQKFSNPRIKHVNKKWILTVGLECENQAPQLSDDAMGIDLGVRKLATVSFGSEQLVFKNINKTRKMVKLEKKRRRIERVISRKYRTNGNYEKTKGVQKYEELLNTIYSRQTDIRNDYIHKTTHALVSLLPYRVTMEDLDVAGMLKNKHVADDISAAKFGEFIRQMKYKCEFYGIEFLQVPRYYPSSKTCSCCGHVYKELGEAEVYKCPECGFIIDRDLNAAINLKDYASSHSPVGNIEEQAS